MSETRRRYQRFPRAYRIEHWLFVASFVTLAITGLAQKFAGAGIAQGLIGVLGGIETVRVIHRIAAVTMMLEAVYHIGAVGYRVFVKHSRFNMLPTLNDARIAIHSFLYNLGLRKDRPQQGRYSFEEKIEYWAVVWGTLIMVLTGFMLWNPIATTSILPGEVVPAAKTAHGNEALLAVLAIIIWHLYHVLVRTRNKSMFTGYLTEEQMLDEHPIELADVKAGTATRSVDPKVAASRRRTFLGVYGVIGAVMLLGIFVFVTFEKTAIETIPPAEQVTIFAPLTPTLLPTLRPTNTPAAEAPEATSPAWDTDIAELLTTGCGACHVQATLGDLSLKTYADALKGGKSGPAIVPGDPDASLLIQIQSKGGHPGQLSADELARFIAWIEAGAPEK
ncbi:MAG TPA: cytochrome b/b6 domain-containing protein [Anaerolineae bacterium]